ncbi:MAG: hypothetical protein N3E45_02255 [Oscillatoriaceae bacterium SKW80]|nr:hypothetical protein [Oscillatoriaceae bacterium SKYG93]MCX8119647.1 hypothetical protein [Oscillatoriaceae bacterium SKW80]MDW8455114.1 hypothetical protein [Oscillatoriaceae cyanobacterium SKYGB_i_bin93]HIK28112.1 hypothetical protein [Oscillatoriaceae cyanobacterium M7585_C2015_266]
MNTFLKSVSISVVAVGAAMSISGIATAAVKLNGLTDVVVSEVALQLVILNEEDPPDKGGKVPPQSDGGTRYKIKQYRSKVSN